MTLRDRPDLDTGIQNQRRIATRAEERGWAVTGDNPLMLEKAGKQIQVKFNGAGMPNGAQWLNGDEFTDMGASGYMNLNTLFDTWLAWEPDEDVDEKGNPDEQF